MSVPRLEELRDLPTLEEFLGSLDALREEPDWRKRARGYTEWLTQLQRSTTYVASERTAAIAEGRAAGASYEVIADVLQVSKSRAQQLSSGFPRGPRQAPATDAAEGDEPAPTGGGAQG